MLIVSRQTVSLRMISLLMILSAYDWLAKPQALSACICFAKPLHLSASILIRMLMIGGGSAGNKLGQNFIGLPIAKIRNLTIILVAGEGISRINLVHGEHCNVASNPN